MIELVIAALIAVIMMAGTVTWLAFRLIFLPISVTMVGLEVQPTEYVMRESLIKGRLRTKVPEQPVGTVREYRA